MSLILSSKEIEDLIDNYIVYETDLANLTKEYVIRYLSAHNIILLEKKITILDNTDDDKINVKFRLSNKQIRKSVFNSRADFQICFDKFSQKTNAMEIVEYHKKSFNVSLVAKQFLEQEFNEAYNKILAIKDEIIFKAKKGKNRVRRENLKIYKDYFRILHSVIQLTAEAFLDLNQRVEKSNKKHEALIRLLGDACHVAQEINVLLLNGFPDGAFSRWRKLYEITVIMSFLHKNDNFTSERYLDFIHVENYRSLNKFKENPILQNDFYQFDEDEINNNYHNVIEKHGESFNRIYGWAAHIIARKRGVTFQAILNESGFENLSYYYQISCSQVHGDAMGMISKLGLPNIAEKNILLGSSSIGLNFPIELTVISLFQIVSIISNSITNYKSILTAKIINSLYENTFRANSHRDSETSSG